jgi:hypothetical protein
MHQHNTMQHQWGAEPRLVVCSQLAQPASTDSDLVSWQAALDSPLLVVRVEPRGLRVRDQRRHTASR